MTAACRRFIPVSARDPTWTMRYARRSSERDTPSRKAAEEREWTDYIKAKADELAGTAADHAERIPRCRPCSADRSPTRTHTERTG